MFVDFITHFHNNTSKHKQIKYLKENDDISFFEYLNSLNLDECTYILSFRSKLTKSYIFLNQTPKNIKTNACNIHVVHLWFANTNI
jgi:hypothetical protein